MKKSVRVFVNSSQQYDDYADQITTNSVGEYHCCKNVHTIDYTEKLEGNAIVCNSLVLKKDTAELHRTGAVTSQMIFNMGHTTDTEYHTTYGKLDFKISTLRYNVNIEEDHIQVLIQYDLLQNSEKVSHNTLQIAIDAQPN